MNKNFVRDRKGRPYCLYIILIDSDPMVIESGLYVLITFTDDISPPYIINSANTYNEHRDWLTFLPSNCLIAENMTNVKFVSPASK